MSTSKDVLLDSFEHGSFSLSPHTNILFALENATLDEFVRMLKKGVDAGYIDVNYYYNDYNGTLLDIALTKKHKSLFISALIRYGPKVNYLNDISKKAPIHVAVENSDLHNVDILVKNKKLDINIRDGDDNTALLIATKRNDLDIIDSLYGHPNIDINAVNRVGQTPLHLALTEGHMDLISLLLSRIDVDVDCKKYNGKSCRDIIEEKYPEISNQIRVNGHLFSLLYSSDCEILRKRIRSNRCILSEHNNDYTFLQWACRWGKTNVVETLVKDFKTDPNARPNTDPPILTAAFHSYYDILSILISAPNIRLNYKYGKNPLHSIFDGLIEKGPYWDDFNDSTKCLKLLLNELKNHKMDINCPDSNGNTILHRAAYLNDDQMVKMILREGASVASINERGEYAALLIKPTVLEEYLNTCVYTNHNRYTDETYAIFFNYCAIIPPKTFDSCRGSNINENACETDLLLKISNVSERRHVLKHPVLTSFLHLKWHIMRKFFYINLIFYFIFWIALTWYILQLYGSKDRGDSITNLVPEDSTWLWYIILIFNVMLFLRELFQFSVSPCTYLKSMENWLEMILIIVTAAVLVNRTDLYGQPQLATLAIFFSWSEAILLIGKHPKLSTNIEMFKKVTKNFLIFLLWYSNFILTFGFIFYILFNERKEDGAKFFRSPWKSIFKSIIMMTGEFGTESIPFDNAHPALSYFLFLLFIFLIAIVLFSLLNGLAISDIQTIKRDAEIFGIICRLEQIYYFERLARGIPWLHRFDNFSTFVPLWQQLRKKFRLRFVFLGITLYPNILPSASVSVLVNRKNAVTFMPGSLPWEKEDYNSCFGRFFACRMDSGIVKASVRILEKKHTANELRNDVCISKLETTQNISQRFEKLLMECSQQLQQSKNKLETLESVSHRTEKFLMECSQQLQDYKSKMDAVAVASKASVYHCVPENNEKLIVDTMSLKQNLT